MRGGGSSIAVLCCSETTNVLRVPRGSHAAGNYFRRPFMGSGKLCTAHFPFILQSYLFLRLPCVVLLNIYEYMGF